MANKFASDKRAIGICDVCGFQYKLRNLRNLVVRSRVTEIKACPTCWDPDHPQLQRLPPVTDPQALRNPRRDTTYLASGLNANSNQGEGSRVFAWGWRPVGGGNELSDTPNALQGAASVGTVTVTTT